MFFDTPKNYQLGFQDPATPIMSGIIDLHHSIFFYLLLILIPVLYFLVKILFHSSIHWEFAHAEHILNYRKDILTISAMIHGTIIEIIWN